MESLQEHQLLTTEPNERYNNLNLVKWDKPTDKDPWGYYAYYMIGAEWIDEKESLIVTTKQNMENIDFLGMFMTCFLSNLDIESFSKIYTIDHESSKINAPALKNVVSPLIVFHFLAVVNRIKTLKRDYVHHSENLRKVKGHIKVLQNERKNISVKRFDRIYCEYDEYSVDIPENRLIKKALLFSQRFLKNLGESNLSYREINHCLSKALCLFENVNDDVDIKDVGRIRSHKIFKDYAEAVRLAKVVLSHFDFSINKVGKEDNHVIPFTLDMSLLYEHYVYGLLYEAYQNKIVYQFNSITGKPDFLYTGNDFKAILDTKYIPKYDNSKLDHYVVKQLSGYGRDLKILKKLGYEDLTEETPLAPVPCVIIYPKEGNGYVNPFLNKSLKELSEKNKISRLLKFYKISVPLPIIRSFGC